MFKVVISVLVGVGTALLVATTGVDFLFPSRTSEGFPDMAPLAGSFGRPLLIGGLSLVLAPIVAVIFYRLLFGRPVSPRQPFGSDEAS